ncbi:MAG: hypothetical protein H5U40_13280 [Polyangiaceae bacterium]|nr:hypothetical protein [Polyangiaceae bacterium]
MRSERRREAAVGPRVAVERAHATADLTLYLRFEGSRIDELVSRFDPHGIVAPEALPALARDLIEALDEATHGALVIAGYKAVPVRRPVPGGLIVCLRTRSRSAIVVPKRPSHRSDLGALLRMLAELDPAEVVSADLLRAATTTDRAAPALEVLLGPHPTPSIP